MRLRALPQTRMVRDAKQQFRVENYEASLQLFNQCIAIASKASAVLIATACC